MLSNDADEELGPDALFLYIKLKKLKSNEDNSNQALMAKTGLKEWSFKQAKAELIDKGYLDTKQVYGNKYAFYIGKDQVERYKNSFKKSYNRRELNQLKETKEQSL
jgi:hypothetical protein